MTKNAPLCRYCGKAIRKHTKWVFLRLRDNRTDYKGAIEVDAWPQTKEECQKYTNLQVISVKRHRHFDSSTDTVTDLGIDQFSTWDGETYVSEFFCNGDHARRFAYVMAKAGQATKAYVAAKEGET